MSKETQTHKTKTAALLVASSYHTVIPPSPPPSLPAGPAPARPLHRLHSQTRPAAAARRFTRQIPTGGLNPLLRQMVHPQALTHTDGGGVLPDSLVSSQSYTMG